MFNLQPLGVEVDASGKVSGVKVVKTALGEPDEAGRRRQSPLKAASTFYQQTLLSWRLVSSRTKWTG